MKRTDLAYIAGIIDGEGTIRIRKQRRKDFRAAFEYQLSIMVENTNKWLVQWLHFAFGGSIYHHKRQKENRNDTWQWQIVSQQAGTFLKLVLPYLKIKRAEAELAIKFQQHKSHQWREGSPKSEEEQALEEAQRILINKRPI